MDSGRALPLPASALLGRDAEVADIAADLLGDGRLVVVTGPPGVGKTRLALGIAEVVAGRFADGVAWVDLVPVRDAGLVIEEIAHGCGLPHVGALEDRETLVVLDNCEHLLDAAPAVAALLAEHPGIRVLATSRERLHVAVEHEWPLGPLPLPDADAATDLRGLAANPAVALVLAHAPAYVDLTARTAQPLVEIIERLDGLPLALEFAAARLRVFTPGELAFRLEHRTDELVATARDTPARHRDLRSAITWSHDLLPDAERAVFRRLSVFEGRWTLADAEAVCGGTDVSDVLGGLESLLDKSLVRRVESDDDGPARFAMLVSLREYAAEQLELHAEGAATRARHAARFADVGRIWEATIGTGSENMAWHRSRLVRGDLECALAVARDRDAEATLWLQAALGWYWYTRGSPVHAVTLVPREADIEAAPPDAGAAALLASGAVAFAMGDLVAAEQRLTAAYAVCEPRGDQRRTAFANAFLGHVDRELGRFGAATAHNRRARAIYEQLDNDRGVGWAACDLGLLVAERGELEPAEDLLREALVMFESLDYGWAVAVASCGLAVVLARRGDADGAARFAVRAYVLHGDAGDVRGVAQSLEALAEVALVRGAAATAARLLGAGAAHRDRAAAPPRAAERASAVRVSAAAASLLGPGEAEREQRAGRALRSSAVRALVAQVAGPEDDDAVPAVGLTARQLEVAALVAAGRTNRQIGRELGISEKTAELHVRNTMQRLGVQNRAGVAAWVVVQPH
jgi:predicted ATPase/DNA-binding CsgD family transcriptional regulator